MIGPRIATGTVHCVAPYRQGLPPPLSQERYGMQPIESPESVATV